MVASVAYESTASPVFYITTGGVDTPMNRSIRKIQSFGSLPPGSHYGRVGSASVKIKRAALTVLSTYASLGFLETDCFPGLDGEILITAYRGMHYVSVTAEIDDTFTVSHRFNKEDKFYEGDRSHEGYVQDLLTIKQAIEQQECDSAFSLISPGFMTLGLESLQTLLSKHQAADQFQEPPSLLLNAVLVFQRAYALTSINGTMGLEAHLLPSGNSSQSPSLAHVT